MMSITAEIPTKFCSPKIKTCKCLSWVTYQARSLLSNRCFVEWWGAGLQWGVNDLHIVQLMSLPHPSSLASLKSTVVCCMLYLHRLQGCRGRQSNSTRRMSASWKRRLHGSETVCAAPCIYLSQWHWVRSGSAETEVMVRYWRLL